MSRGFRSVEHQKLLAVIVDARTRAGLSQRELCAKLGWPPSRLGKLEAGERGLSVLEFVALARACGADPATLLRRVLR